MAKARKTLRAHGDSNKIILVNVKDSCWETETVVNSLSRSWDIGYI